MRTDISSIFAFLMLLGLIIGTGCSTPSPAGQLTPTPTGTQDSGFTRISAESGSFLFDEAYRNLRQYPPEAPNVSSVEMPVYYIHGTDLDLSGNASAWIFGVRYAGETTLLSYSGGGWQRIPWDVSLTGDGIDMEKIMTPDRLFSRNSEEIQGSPPPGTAERRDLDLARGVYTLTIASGDAERVLTFNATTGGPVLQP